MAERDDRLQVQGAEMIQELRWETAGLGGRVFLVFGWLFMWGVVFPIGALALIVAAGSIGDAMLTREPIEQCQCK